MGRERVRVGLSFYPKTTTTTTTKASFCFAFFLNLDAIGCSHGEHVTVMVALESSQCYYFFFATHQDFFFLATW